MQLLRKAYHIPIGFSTPAWLLEIGAVIIRTETELVLKSRWVYPKRLLEAGFTFSFVSAAAAIKDIAQNK